jgi:hypothetical protein
MDPHQPTPENPMTPAEELHAAAEKLRALAQQAEQESPSPWRLDGDVVRCETGGIVADASGEPDRAGDLPYIAALPPSVGGELAELLDNYGAHLTATTHPDWQETVGGPALAIARQILGSQP